MLLNYLKLSLRLMVRSPFFTIINVLGLSVGFAAFYVLWQHAMSELKTDQYHKDFQRIGRIGANWYWTEEGQSGHTTLVRIMSFQSSMILADFPEIENHTRFASEPSILMGVESNGQKTFFKETAAIRAEPNLFDFFTIPLIHGDSRTLLRKANAVVLSQKTATRCFGNDNPLGRLLIVNDTTTMVVTGVFQDLPHNTHLAFDVVLSNVGRESEWDEAIDLWVNCYVKLNSPDAFEKLTHAINLKTEKYWERILKIIPQGRADLFLQPLHEIAFSSFSKDLFEPKSRLLLVILAIVAVLIQLMAWINYINLAVSRSMKRLKEIATRKVSGALRMDFMKQFLMESLVMNALAIAVAFTIIQLIRHPLSFFFQIQVADFASVDTETWLVFLFFVATGIVVTALYPAFMSNSYNPRSLLTIHAGPGKKRFLPSLLTTVQYTAAFALIAWAFIMYAQLNYVLHNDLGINKANVVVLDAPLIKSGTYEADMQSFLIQVKKQHSATVSNSIFEEDGSFRVKRPGQETYKVLASNGGVDETFIPFYGITLLAGRNFRPNEPADAILISQYAAERLGYEKIQDALGERILVNTDEIKDRSEQESDIAMEVIGVFKDYSQNSFLNYGESNTQAVTGMGIGLTFKNELFPAMITERVSIRMDMKEFDQKMSAIEEEYLRIFPESPLNWYFLDERINRAYDREKTSSDQIALFTILAIGISCLGLLGMISNKVEEKTKEIGIRKVLGAGIGQIGNVLLQTTVRQVVAAVALGIPIAFYLGNQYLGHYTERIDLQWWHFAAPVFFLLLILFATISSMLWRAANNNPVEALKYE